MCRIQLLKLKSPATAKTWLAEYFALVISGAWLAKYMCKSTNLLLVSRYENWMRAHVPHEPEQTILWFLNICLRSGLPGRYHLVFDRLLKPRRKHTCKVLLALLATSQPNCPVKYLDLGIYITIYITIVRLYQTIIIYHPWSTRWSHFHDLLTRWRDHNSGLLLAVEHAKHLTSWRAEGGEWDWEWDWHIISPKKVKRNRENLTKVL